MKPSSDSSLMSYELGLLALKRSHINNMDKDSSLCSLYIDLCNLIVESRTPGINERGYGEGVHCPPFMGPNSHRCNLSLPECQKHQGLIQRLLCGSRDDVFDIEVLLLPECCQNQNDSQISERIANMEYVLLERWSLNCQNLCKAHPTIDVNQLLRAVRSFLYFSQLSAWLSSNKGKSPTNIYYWVKTPAEVSTTKFDSEPETHTFPNFKIGDTLCGKFEVTYRPRTQYVPIIPCSKHPPLSVSSFKAMNGDSEPCQNMPKILDGVKHMQNNIDASHQSTILSKVAKTSTTALLISAPNLSSPPMKMSFGECSNVDANRYLKYTKGQTNVENVSYSMTYSHKDSDKSSNIPVSPLKSQPSDLGVRQDIYFKCSSQENIRKRRHSVQCHETECKHKKKNWTSCNSNLSTSDTKRLSLQSMHHVRQENKKNLKNCSSYVFQTKQIDLLKTSVIQPDSKNSEIISLSPKKENNRVSKKRKLSPMNEKVQKPVATSQNIPTDSKQVPDACTSSKCSGLQQLSVTANRKSKNQSLLKLNLNNMVTANYFVETCVEYNSQQRILRDVKNTPENVSYPDASSSKLGQRIALETFGHSISVISDQNRNVGNLPLPSSPIPFKDSMQNFQKNFNIIPYNKRKSLFQTPDQNIDCLPKHISRFNRGGKLLGSFEESILKGCLQPVSSVKGFTVEIGASGCFCPDHVTLPADVYFYDLGSSHQAATPYLAHVILRDAEYYVPKKGAVQVTLFNPCETVVKMFVVNYDLSNMPPLCHTFIREKTFYMPVGGTEKDPTSQKWLRYIIHLRFASSRTGRIFLNKDFKIVILNKSDVDAASIHSQEPHELRSFISIPMNPMFSGC